MGNILSVQKVQKYYGNKASLTRALDVISFDVEQGEFLAIMGASGSGKTTLLNCISTIDKVTAGHIFVAGQDITELKGKELNRFRREELGFIFQDFNLLDTFSIQDNIFLPLVLAGKSFPEMNARLKPIAAKLEIEKILRKYPYEVSGGEKQRAAVARALITDPQLVLADEPTGALDSRATNSLLRLFEDINGEGQTIVMVTHSTKAASHARRVLFLRDGEVFHQLYRAGLTEQEMFQKISDTLTTIATGGGRGA